VTDRLFDPEPPPAPKLAAAQIDYLAGFIIATAFGPHPSASQKRQGRELAVMTAARIVALRG
jgi:hypothetical protein